MRLRTDGHPDGRGPAIEQAVSAFKGEAAELYVAPVVQSAHPGDGGVIDNGADLEAKVLCWGELCSQLACQHCIRPIRLAEVTHSFRFDFCLPQLTTSEPCVKPKMNCVSTSPARAAEDASNTGSIRMRRVGFTFTSTDDTPSTTY